MRSSGDRLQQQLDDSRQINLAIGLIMQRYEVTDDRALELLRAASRWTGQPIDRVARDYVRTGNVVLDW